MPKGNEMPTNWIIILQQQRLYKYVFGIPLGWGNAITWDLAMAGYQVQAMT